PGGLRAGAVLADGGVALWSLGASGWRRAADLVRPGGADRAEGFALVGHRSGPTCAVVGGGGVRLRSLSSGDAWWRPTLRPATRVALLQGADWRLSLAAVVEDEVHCWQEDEALRWRPVPLEQC
ncbi:hypothetical protein ABUW04_05945, partial [Streptacidiphilus sp. N1-10]